MELDPAMDDLYALRRKLYEARGGSPVILTAFPLKTRARLRFASYVNAAGIWLVEHGHTRSAVLLWRACGLW
jgi:hypothetical protein